MSDESEGKKRGFLRRLFGRGGEDAAEPQAVPSDEADKRPESDAAEVVELAATAPNHDETAGSAIGLTAEAAADAGEKAPEPEAAATEPSEDKRGFLSRLKQRLGKTKAGLVEKVRQVISFHTKVDEELLEEIETILVQADVGIETTTKILDEVRRNREARRVEDPEALIPIIKEAILGITSHSERTLTLQPVPPTVMLVVGVNGTGKTTTIGKLAKQYRDQGKKVMMVAGDTFRAAAVEQLAVWAERTGSQIVKQPMGADPGAVCYDALASAGARDFDVILIDTAGRLQTKTNLMEELKKISRVIKKVMPTAPHETLLVLDATTGQNALSQAKLFSEAVGLTGLVMTKLDGTAKGGILIALRDQFDVPVLKIGIGESVDDLRDFEPQAFVDALFEK